MKEHAHSIPGSSDFLLIKNTLEETKNPWATKSV